MEPKLDLQPLQTYLTEGITPQELSLLLDELMFDYVRLNFSEGGGSDEPEDADSQRHPDAGAFIFQLRELRNTLWQCNCQ